MHYSYSSQRNNIRWKIIIGIAAVIAAMLVLFFITRSAPPETPNSTTAAPAANQEVSGKYLFSGTVIWGRAVENEARKPNGSIDYAQPFSQLSSFNPAQYDAWAADIECPVTMRNLPYRTQVANTVFNCRPEFLPEMSKYITLANVANNHTLDAGQDGYDETVKHIAQAGMQSFGNYSPRVTNDICEAVALPVRIADTQQKGVLPVAFCAWHYFDFEPQPGELEQLDKYAEIMPVFAFMQVGTEYRPNADAKQKQIGRALAERNVEFVVGNSPHWVQETEVHNNKLIVYSTGNFIFDQLESETNRGASLEVSMTIKQSPRLNDWLALGEQCKQHGDSCLQKARDQQLPRLTPEYTFGLVGSTGGYKQVTKRADGAIQAAIESRAQWPQTLKQVTKY